jgi:uncharacterized RDD family membrane protein YckC
MPIAPLWRRLAAMLYDSIVLIGLWIIVSFLVTAAFGIDSAGTAESQLNPLYRYTLLAAMLGSAYLFFGWFWVNSGQTIGMQAWKLRVQNADGSAIGWRQVGLRYISAPLALAVFGFGYWWALFDRQHRSWPDIASHSYIVTVPR